MQRWFCGHEPLRSISNLLYWWLIINFLPICLHLYPRLWLLFDQITPWVSFPNPVCHRTHHPPFSLAPQATSLLLFVEASQPPAKYTICNIRCYIYKCFSSSTRSNNNRSVAYYFAYYIYTCNKRRPFKCNLISSPMEIMAISMENYNEIRLLFLHEPTLFLYHSNYDSGNIVFQKLLNRS